jgi:hypothetical protein
MCTLYRLTTRYVEHRGRLGMAHEEMQRHSQSRAVRYAEAVLRRAGAGRPLSVRLPRYCRTVG